MAADEEDISELKRELSNLKPELRKYIHSLDSKDIVQLITVNYQAFLRKEGVHHPDVEKLFLSLWNYLQKEIKDGFQILNTKVPGLNSIPLEWTSMEIMGWKMGRDQFYEERIDEINLQFGVDLRVARGYQVVKDLFTRKIDTLEKHLKTIQDGHNKLRGQLEHGQKVLDESRKVIEDAQKFLDSRKELPINDEKILKAEIPPVNKGVVPLHLILREFMAQENLSIDDVATKISRSRSTVNNLLSGKASQKAESRLSFSLDGFKIFVQNYTHS